MTQYGFYFDQKVCAGCHTCQIACKDRNRLDVGYLLRDVKSYERGEFPAPAIYHFAKTDYNARLCAMDLWALHRRTLRQGLPCGPRPQG